MSCTPTFENFCGPTINTEKEEATFNKLKTSTNSTSNHHSDHILTKCPCKTADAKRTKRSRYSREEIHDP